MNINKLIALADRLDAMGAKKEADEVDEFIRSAAGEFSMAAPGSPEELDLLNAAHKNIQNALEEIERSLGDIANSSMTSPKLHDQREALHHLKVLFGWQGPLDTGAK